MRRFVTRSGLSGLAALALLTGVSTCAAPEPPTNPSWDVDVYPIIRGSCANCHGDTAGLTGPGMGFRFDTCNPADFKIGERAALGLGATGLAPLILADVLPPSGGGRPKMPPAPAEPLSEYEVGVLRNWVKVVEKANGDLSLACRKSVANRDPRARLVSRTKDGNDLVAVLDITDLDGDIVLGTVANSDDKITSVGRRTVRVKGSQTIKLQLTDGWATVDVTFEP
jgi:hypothetical protein